jgi:hypothetical protein
VKKKTKKQKIKELLGRDPTMGIPSFKTGVNKTKKDKQKNRGTKEYRKKLEQDLLGE